jgi:iron complex outermembrane recepter protein
VVARKQDKWGGKVGYLAKIELSPMFKRTLICALYFLASAVPPAASAADVAYVSDQTVASSDALQVIVVTATRRSEALLRIPESISALESTDIMEGQIENLEDVARVVPGLVVTRDSEQTQGFDMAIRGIPSVATYVDDTPIPTSTLKIFDVDRVEVLRGPQGTLFGASSMGGAIRYVTPGPGFDTYSGFANVETGFVDSGGQSSEVQVAGGGPLVNQALAFRGSAFFRRDGGYIDLANEDTGAIVKRDINSTNSYGGRFSLAGRPSDFIEANASVTFQKQVDNGLPDYFTGRGSPDSIPLPIFERVQRVPQFRSERIVLPNLTIKADFGFATLTSSTSYLDWDWGFQNDFSYFVEAAVGLDDLTGGKGMVTPNYQTVDQGNFIQEIRLASSAQGPFEWLVGGYYEHDHRSQSQLVTSNLGTYVPSLAPAVLPGDIVYVNQIYDGARQEAVFGEASYSVFKALKITAGLRYTDLSMDISQTANGLFNGGSSFQSLKSEENGIVSPKFSISYDLGETMVYATASKGFRPGGPNSAVPVGIPDCAAELRTLGKTNVPASYNTDDLWTYELGLKGLTFERKFAYEVAAYQVDWSGLQENINLAGGCGFSYTDNVGNAKVQGVEASVSWLPIEGLKLGLNGSYSYGRLVKALITGADQNGPVVAAPAGRELPDLPRGAVSVSAQYKFNVTSDWHAYLRGDYQYIGELARDLGTPTDDPRVLNEAGYGVTNGRFGALRGPWEVALFAKNLFNQRPTIYESYADYAPGNAAELTTIQPRYVGIYFSRKFQ